MRAIAAHGRLACALVAGLTVPTETFADARGERQAMIAYVLSAEAASNVALDRAACVTGQMAQTIPRSRASGSTSLPDAGDYCVAVLTRSARAGVRTLLRGSGAASSTPASAFDNGFMLAFQRGEALPLDLPTMATLRPVAGRCFAMSEPNVRLCYAAGYAFGQRAYHGENVIVG